MWLKSITQSKKLRILLPIIVFALTLLLIFVFRSSLIPGWYEENGKTFYLEFPFKRASEIKTIGNKQYIFADYGSHELLYGFVKVDGLLYYTNEKGAIVKGEHEINGELYNFDSVSGVLYQNEMRIVDGRLWYFNDHGIKTFGIVEIDGEKYCFNEGGNLKKGLQVIDGKTYYFQPKEGSDKETMQYGFMTVGEFTYYFGSDGAAVTGEHIIDGEPYVFDDEGKLIG